MSTDILENVLFVIWIISVVSFTLCLFKIVYLLVNSLFTKNKYSL